MCVGKYIPTTSNMQLLQLRNVNKDEISIITKTNNLSDFRCCRVAILPNGPIQTFVPIREQSQWRIKNIMNRFVARRRFEASLADVNILLNTDDNVYNFPVYLKIIRWFSMILTFPWLSNYLRLSYRWKVYRYRKYNPHRIFLVIRWECELFCEGKMSTSC